LLKKRKRKKKRKRVIPPQTLFSINEASFSGYGAPAVNWARIGNKNTCLIGGKGGLTINDHFVIGGAGYGLAYPSEREDLSGNTYLGEKPYLHFEYGGGLLEYYFLPKFLMPISLGVLVGAGGLHFSNEVEGDDHKNKSDIFFIVQPELTIYLNVTRFFRIGAGASYRFTNEIEKDSFTDNDFHGPAVSLGCEAGFF